MRKHGWQLPYHPLQVVAVAVFLALGFAFYVFFAPFVGKQLFQYIVMGMYTPILICSFGLYIWCAGVDPADPGVFSSKKYLNIAKNKKLVKPNGAKNGREPTSSACNANGSATCEEANNNKGKLDMESRAHRAKETERKGMCYPPMFAFLPCASMCNSHEEPSCRKSEDGMFYCRLCEVEVSKYSKHCRVCDKCVDCFDHHCRWLNNCVGKRNYRKFFTLMVSALLLLIVQWSTGVLVLTLCFLEKTKFSTDIRSKLGSSFTIVPFVIVVAVCTILAMIATVPLAQLFFFHILLINKGISTYDYIIALREQEQIGAGGQQSPQMSPVSSVTGLSSSSSFNTFHRAAWCTPPPLFLEDQHDVVPPEHGSVSSLGKKITHDEPTKKKNSGPVKISPWLLARLNADDVSKAAAEARKKSKILQPVTDISFSSSSRMMGPRPDSNTSRGSRRILLPVDVPLDPLSRHHHGLVIDKSSSLGALHMEAPSDYRGPSGGGIGASSPESSSLDSLDIHPFRASSSGPEEEMRLVGLPVANQADVPLSRSTSDGYDASGGEDSDPLPTRRMINRSSALFGSEPDRNVSTFVPPSSSMLFDRWKF